MAVETWNLERIAPTDGRSGEMANPPTAELAADRTALDGRGLCAVAHPHGGSDGRTERASDRPVCLGVWLGDGDRRTGRVTNVDRGHLRQRKAPGSRIRPLTRRRESIVLVLSLVAALWATPQHATPPKAEAARFGGQLVGASEFGQGDGQLGGPLACGGRYSSLAEQGVANRTLPCGAKVVLCLDRSRRCVTARVKDRGPYAGGRDFDLMYATARSLGTAFPWSGTLRWRRA